MLCHSVRKDCVVKSIAGNVFALGDVAVLKNGNVVTVECEPELYYEKQIGQKIYCKAYKGFFTGSTWSMYGVR